jgi:hypothetical protein
MRISLVLFLMIIFFSAAAQQKDSTCTFKEIGWRVTVQADFQIADNQKAEEATQRGLGMVKGATGVKGDISHFKVLVYAKNSPGNMFQASLEDFARGSDSGLRKTMKHVKDVLYTTIAKEIPTSALDSISSIQEIDGMSFDKFDLKITLEGRGEAHTIMLSKYYKGYDFGITYSYINDSIKQEIETMLQNSKFDK